MKLVICKPDKKVTGFHDFKIELYNELASFYTLLEQVLQELNIDYTIKTIGFVGSTVVNKGVCIGHHIFKNPPNTWSIKRGYLTGYLYFDKKGYSGWSEGLERYNPKADYNKKDITETLIKTQYYIDNNISKIPQPKITNIPKKPYVIVCGQKPGDSVANLAYIKTNKLSGIVRDAYKNTGINVYVREHPGLGTKEAMKGSIHELLKHANAVYTVNSGTGFEALLQGKQVYTAGACDYSIVTTVVKNAEDVYNTRFQSAPSIETIGHFLHCCLTEHFVDAFDKKSIKRKVLRVLKEYEEDNL
jgi:hypothetical protein